MMRSILPRICCLGLLLGVMGCPSPVKEKTYTVSVQGPLAQAKQIVQSYAEGTPPGSEMDSFPNLINKVKEVDPNKATLLEKGVADIRRGGDTRAKAKALLKKL